MYVIRSFKDIELQDSSLIICDIDDTILDYGEKIEEYWKSKIHDPGFLIWHEVVKSISPSLTSDDFHDFLLHVKNTNSEIHLVTHRNENFIDITFLHLDQFGIKDIEIHFLAGKSKGKYSVDNFEVNNRHVVFIDDSENNHKDVLKHIPHVKSFLFKKIVL